MIGLTRANFIRYVRNHASDPLLTALLAYVDDLTEEARRSLETAKTWDDYQNRLGRLQGMGAITGSIRGYITKAGGETE